MTRVVLTTAIILLAITTSLAQTRLYGRVTDADGNGVELVKIIMKRDSVAAYHATTDSLGRYAIARIVRGRYVVTYNGFGYQTECDTLQMSGTDSTVVEHNVTLSLGPARELGGVTVTTDRFVQRGDTLIAIPTANQVKHSIDGYTLLRSMMIPGLNVNARTGALTAFGEGVSIYIDGVKASNLDIKNLRPREVLRVEFMVSPSGKYAGDITALNLVTKKYDYGGYAAADATQRAGYNSGDYNATAKIYRHNNRFSVFGGYADKRVTDNDSYLSETFELESLTVTRHSESWGGIVSSNSAYAQLNGERTTECRMIKASAIAVRNATPRSSRTSQLTYTSDHDASSVSNSDTRDRGLRYGLNLYARQSVGRSQFVEATITGNYGRNHNVYYYSQPSVDIFSDVKENAWDASATFNYGLTLHNGSQLTGKIMYFYRVSMSDYDGTTASWQHLRSGEGITSVEYLHRVGPRVTFRVNPGLSWLQYCVHGFSPVSRISPRLSLVVTWQPAVSQFVMFNTAVGNSYPTMALLSNVDRPIDEFIVIRGNPELDNTKLYRMTGSYNINLRRVSLQAAAVWQIMHRLPVSTYHADGSHMIHSYVSDVTGHNLNGYVAANWRPSTRLGMALNVNYGLYDYGSRSATLNRLSGQLQLSYYIGNFALNGFAQSSNAVIGTDLRRVTIPCSYGVSSGWAAKGCSVEFGLDNPFSRNMKYRFETVVTGYRSTGWEKSVTTGPSAYLRFSYTFNFGGKTTRDQFQGDKTINSAILK